MIERRHPTPRKGERLVGYRPVAGRPVDAKGALLLVWQFINDRDMLGERRRLNPEERVVEREATEVLQAAFRESVTVRKVLRRGALKVEQGNLL